MLGASLAQASEYQGQLFVGSILVVKRREMMESFFNALLLFPLVQRRYGQLMISTSSKKKHEIFRCGNVDPRKLICW